MISKREYNVFDAKGKTLNLSHLVGSKNCSRRMHSFARSLESAGCVIVPVASNLESELWPKCCRASIERYEAP
jgi:hypothetical protein